MNVSPWQRRTRRAHELINQNPFAAELLGFYVEVAAFQEKLHDQFSRASWPKTSRHSMSDELMEPALSVLSATFGEFWRVVETHGTPQLIELSRQLSHAGRTAWSKLLCGAWKMQSPTEPQELLAMLFLQPYLEWLRSRLHERPNSGATTLCPFCRRKPGLGVLRPLGEGAARSLVCFLCLHEWEFRRIVCPACGEENSEKLAVYFADELDYIRLECCDACKTYLKTVDLSKNGAAEAWIDEIASVPLDLWAVERGYHKLQKNLLGM